MKKRISLLLDVVGIAWNEKVSLSCFGVVRLRFDNSRLPFEMRVIVSKCC